MASEGLAAVVAGAGLMGRWHAHEVSRVGGRVVAVADPDLGRAERLAGRHGGAAVFASVDEALDAVDADALHLCAPGDAHVPLAEAALGAGLHVLCEKPLAPDAGSTRSLLDRAREAGRLLCPVHQFLFQRGARRLFRSLDELGPVRHVDFTACSAGAAGGRDPASVAREILPHPLSFLERLAPGGLGALSWEAVEAAPGEVRVAAADDGFTASVLVSMAGRPTANGIRVVGEGGTARLNLYHGYAVVSPAGRPTRVRKAMAPFLSAGREIAAAAWNLGLRAVRRQPAFPGLRELVRRFHRAAVGAGEPPIAAGEAIRTAEARDRLMDRMAEAAGG
jgi:predicted dehydrogenase